MLTPEQAHAYLLSLPRFTEQGASAYKPGLERMHRLLEGMGRPHERFPSVHVAGTNGKGSTASLIAAIGGAAGRRMGLHTSPHLRTVNERMRIDGRCAPDEWLAASAGRFQPLFERVRPSFFEATVALSFLYFAESRVDMAVVEVGLGGRLDATNVLHPLLAVITGIGLDHTDLLGDTVEAIAEEKAGIIKRGAPVLSGVRQEEARRVIERVARERGASYHDLFGGQTVRDVRLLDDGCSFVLQTPVRRYEELFCGLGGVHQAGNAGTAVRAAEMLFPDLTEEAVRTGLREVKERSGLRGRLEVVGREPYVVVDVAHNPEGLEAALRFTRSLPAESGSRLYVLFGLMRDKDVGEMAGMLHRAEATVFAVRLDAERAIPAAEMERVLKEKGVSCGGRGALSDGLAWFRRAARRRDVLLVVGSHQLAADAPGLHPCRSEGVVKD